jgi:dTDP-4-dehydrorhamnose reductase
MLGREVEQLLTSYQLRYAATDVECDITHPDDLANFISDKNIDWIVNCSAYTAVDQAEHDREGAYQINAHGVQNIAAIASRCNATLIHISTDYVFSGDKQGVYTEEDETTPHTIYGQSKLAGEQLLRKMCKKYFILRTAWMYGRYGNNFVKTMLTKFKHEGALRIVNDQWGSPTLAYDLANAILQVIQINSRKYGIYHVTNQGCITWFRFAREIYKQASALHLIDKQLSLIPVSSQEYKSKAKRPMNSILSTDKLNKELGIEMRSWQTALKFYLETEGAHAAQT